VVFKSTRKKNKNRNKPLWLDEEIVHAKTVESFKTALQHRQ
jgi:hypothetical protein